MSAAVDVLRLRFCGHLVSLPLNIKPSYYQRAKYVTSHHDDYCAKLKHRETCEAIFRYRIDTRNDGSNLSTLCDSNAKGFLDPSLRPFDTAACDDDLSLESSYLPRQQWTMSCQMVVKQHI